MTCEVFLARRGDFTRDLCGLNRLVQSLPQALDTRFAVNLSADEAAEHRDQAHDFANLRSDRRFLAVQLAGQLAFPGTEDQGGVHLSRRRVSAQPHQVAKAPRHD